MIIQDQSIKLVTGHVGRGKMKINEVIAKEAKATAGPDKCWPGFKKVGTKPGTGKNKGKTVNDCEKK